MHEIAVALIPYAVVVGIGIIRIIKQAKSVDLSRANGRLVVCLMLIALIMPFALLFGVGIGGKLNVKFLFTSTLIGLWLVIYECLVLVLEIARTPAQGSTGSDPAASAGVSASKQSRSE